MWKHKKRGTKYRILHEATMQSSDEKFDYHPMVVYQDVDSQKIWVRSVVEFMDGRFEKVDDTPKIPILHK